MGMRQMARIAASVLLSGLLASGAWAGTKRILLVGDSWPMSMAAADAFGVALRNLGVLDVDWYSGSGGMQQSAIGGSKIRDWANDYPPPDDQYPYLSNSVNFLNENPTIDMIVLTLGGNDFLGVWKPWFTPAQEQAIWNEACYGTDGNHGLKLIFDTLLAVRPDIKIVFSSYDYVGKRDNMLTMDLVQSYNEANERYTQGIIDFINLHYKSPARAFLVNNLGLMQYTFGYPGPSSVTIPDYFWPDGPPAWPHAFRFNPGGCLFPGNEASGYVPLAGGDPTFRISPYVGLIDPPLDGWIHLSLVGYVALADNVLDQYIMDWLDYPKVYAVERATMNPYISTQLYNPTGLDEVTFEVQFNEPVNGVDIDDFDPMMQGGVTGAAVESVDQAKVGEAYIVTVSTGVGNGTLGLRLIDNDSITDLGGRPLGGAGTSNGDYSYGTPYTIIRGYGLPVAAWPAALALLAFGVARLRKRS